VAPCEACLADRTARDYLEYRGATVEGSLRPEADIGFATCRRGHRVRVRRAARVPLRAVR
jgi:hypothetical protein